MSDGARALRIQLLIGFMCVALIVYFVLLGRAAFILIGSGEVAPIGLGLAILILPFYMRSFTCFKRSTASRSGCADMKRFSKYYRLSTRGRRPSPVQKWMHRPTPPTTARSHFFGRLHIPDTTSSTLVFA